MGTIHVTCELMRSCREGWLGDYDFKYLCMPTMPFGKGKGRRKPPPFYSLNADLPMLLAIVCGEYDP